MGGGRGHRKKDGEREGEGLRESVSPGRQRTTLRFKTEGGRQS